MTSSTRFFCSEREETEVLEYLVGDENVMPLILDPFDYRSITPVSLADLPQWPASLVIFLHHQLSGPIRWYHAKPEIRQQTHTALVNSVLAQAKWNEMGLHEGDSLVNLDASPIQIYRRGVYRDGQIGPCEIIRPASVVERFPPDFSRWEKRCKAWIRRRSTRVHDWKNPSPSLPNPLGLLSSIYAFPDALSEIETGNSRYAILLV